MLEKIQRWKSATFALFQIQIMEKQKIGLKKLKLYTGSEIISSLRRRQKK
ncbi:hypothetical protein [Thermoanaerobacterium sp. R66]|nr:hypothetical protein [Thermoanaerobacterium sp. R66]